ncbi:MAG: VOC family protein, partial [Desulfobacula sp.]|nr:VOC family protein [Desulfobacula sp.]
MIIHLDHINIVVENLEEAEAFFRMLGFKKLHEGDLSGGWISKIVGLDNVRAHYVALALPENRTTLELIHYESPKGNNSNLSNRANDIGFRHLALEVEDIHAEVRRLKKIGIKFLSEVRTYETTGKKLVYFYGPERILLELAQ